MAHRRVMAAFRVYENELIGADDQDANRVPFQAFTLESFIDALAEAGASGLARDLWGPYSDFERVYHLSLGEYLKNPSSHTFSRATCLAQSHRRRSSPKRQKSERRSSEQRRASCRRSKQCLNGGVDHLDSRILGRGKSVYDTAPDTSPPPANEAVIAGSVRAKRLRQIAPGRSRSQDPENTVEDTTVVHPRDATRLVGQHRFYDSPFIVSESIAHDSRPPFGSLNHGRKAKHNAPLPRPRHRYFRGKADIDQPTIPAGSVENDPIRTRAAR